MASERADPPDWGEVNGYVPTLADWAIYHAKEIEFQGVKEVAQRFGLSTKEVRAIYRRMKRVVEIERDGRHEILRKYLSRLQYIRKLLEESRPLTAFPDEETTRTVKIVGGRVVKDEVKTKKVCRKPRQADREYERAIADVDKKIAKAQAELAAYERDLAGRSPEQRVADQLEAYGHTFQKQLDEALFRADVKSLDAQIERELDEEQREEERKRRAMEEN